MKKAEILKEQLTQLQYLAWLQRGTRAALRSFWLGITGVLFGWGWNALWGWLPDWRTWLLVGFVFSLPPLIAFLVSLSTRSEWVWAMDRRLALQEQISTAWQVAEKGTPGLLPDALVQDSLMSLVQVRKRMLKYGWFLERDLLSTLIVLLLAAMVFPSMLIRSYPEVANNPPRFRQMDSSASSPQESQQEVDSAPGQPGSGGVPGDNPNFDAESSPSDSVPAESGQPGVSSSEMPATGGIDLQALGDALQELGVELGKQAPTFDLGQSLQSLDLEQAAGDLENLTDQLDSLAPETKQELADVLRQAAKDVADAGLESIAQDMRGAADALESQADQPARDQLDQLAQKLRELADEMPDAGVAGSGAGDQGAGGTGSPESADRLRGEGGNMELPSDDTSHSGILSPAPPDAAGSGIASGTLDDNSAAGDEVIRSPLLPNYYLWKWRDVVSSYFRR